MLYPATHEAAIKISASLIRSKVSGVFSLLAFTVSKNSCRAINCSFSKYSFAGSSSTVKIVRLCSGIQSSPLGYFTILICDMNRKLPLFLLLALLTALFLEITLFNYTHYATLFTSEHFGIVHSEQEQGFVSNANEYLLKGVSVQDSFLLPTQLSNFEFKNLNTEIASIYINPIFIQGDVQHIRIIWADEESSMRFIDVSIIKGLDFSNYININPRGKVSNLSIAFFENNIAIKQVELNKEIPMAIMPIRLLIVFGTLLLLLCLLNAELRKKISYFCFDYLYNKTDFKQRLYFAMLICSMIIFNFLAAYSVYGFKDDERGPNWLKMYSHFMTDALLKKQLHLDIEVPQAFLEIERPYDEAYRMQHGMFLNYYQKHLDTLENALMPDPSLYKGKFYSYFGMVPVIILFAPYKLLTGNYLPNTMGMFLFGSIATILLMLLWKQIAQDYLKKLPYFFFLIGGAALYASSLISINLTVKYYHPIAQYSALAFVIFGIIVLLKAKEKLSNGLLFASSLSFALAVACRPSALLWSILIPVMLWDKRKELINARKAFAIIIPFVIVGTILAWYNYIRFDSPFTFGDAYQLVHNANNSMVSKMSIIGKIHLCIKIFLFTLFNPPNLDLTFPFVSAKMSNIPLANSFIYDKSIIVGIFCFPIMWFLFYVKKINILRNFIFAGFFISLLNEALIVSMGIIEWRYTMDFAWIMAIGALICAFQFQENCLAMRKFILKTFYSCCGITLLLAFFLAISYRTHSWSSIGNILDPKIYHYLARTFGVICNVP
ncbi:hypothetical protein R83H12_01728 [Fibrobacteria bacterium R8-3-H12]